MNWFLIRESLTVLLIFLFYTLPIAIPVYLFAPETFLIVAGSIVGLVVISVLYSVVRSWIHRYRQEYIESEELQSTMDTFSDPLTQKLSLPMPSISVVADSVVNARAGGLSYRTGYVELTEGLVMYLNPADLKVVISHELSHIKSRDGLIIHLLQGPYSVIVWIMIMIRYIQAKTDSIIVSLPIYIIQVILKLYSSVLLIGIRSIMRGREHLADRDAARVTSKQDVIQTLQKLQSLSSDSEESSSLFNEYTDSLFHTHPSIEERINHLQKTDLTAFEE